MLNVKGQFKKSHFEQSSKNGKIQFSVEKFLQMCDLCSIIVKEMCVFMFISRSPLELTENMIFSHSRNVSQISSFLSDF